MTAFPLKEESNQAYRWQFFRAGNVDQVVLRTAEDLRQLGELDQKLWMALSMPVHGLTLDPKTLAFLDSDADARLRPPEILAAVAWICEVLRDPALIFQPGTSIPLDDIQEPELQLSARFLVDALGKADEAKICLEDVLIRGASFASLPFNGDGIIPPTVAEDPATAQAITDIIAIVGSVTDTSGLAGLDREHLERFTEQVKVWRAWQEDLAKAAKAVGLKDGQIAVEAFLAVKDKIDDYFMRCRFAAFDNRVTSLMMRDESDLKLSAQSLLKPDSNELAGFPLAIVGPGFSLPLYKGVNPVWQDRLKTFTNQVLVPLLGDHLTSLDEKAWEALSKTIQNCLDCFQRKPEVSLAELAEERISQLIEEEQLRRIRELLERDEQRAQDRQLIDRIEKLLLYRRDLATVLRNFVNFSDFYSSNTAVFQSGTLYLAARACLLCVEVSDDSSHANLAALSGAFLVYCDIKRPGMTPRKIVAVVSGGDDESLMVGRNGVFYDRQGKDWDARITRIVSAPISVRQAFWKPYKKFFRMIEEQIIKSAQSAEAQASQKLSDTAATVVKIDSNGPLAAESPVVAASPKKLDLGAIALIGTAIGGISALVGNFFQALFSLGLWLPVGIIVLILMISGPSMLLASLKLRKRNLGPLLDANGWAINTMARINIPFGASLTRRAVLAPGAISALSDPFAEKKKSRKALILLGLFALVTSVIVFWIGGLFDPLLSAAFRFPNIVKAVANFFKP